MRRRDGRVSWRWVAATVVGLSGCAQQFRAASVTGQLGSELAQHQHTMSDGGANCVAALAYVNPGDFCAKDIGADEQWQTVVLALTTYSQRLSALAASRSNASAAATAKLSGAYSSLGASSLSSGSSPSLLTNLERLVNALSGNDPQQTLRRLVRQVGPSADTLARLLSEHVALQLEQLANTRTALCAALERDNRQVVSAISNQREYDVQANRADKLAHVHELGRLLSEQRAQEQAQQALRLFIRAHHALVRTLNKPDYDDDQAVANVLAAMMTKPETSEPDRKATNSCQAPQK